VIFAAMHSLAKVWVGAMVMKFKDRQESTRRDRRIGLKNASEPNGEGKGVAACLWPSGYLIREMTWL
jgi:hypothetical protein